MSKVWIDAGHGGKDSGAVGNGLKEKDITLSIALKLGKVLKEQGFEVGYSRTTDVYLDLTPRATKANQFKADAFVSVHVNSAASSTATGLEVWTSKGQTKGDILATAIGEQLQKDFPNIAFRKDMSDGDLDKEENFTVLAKTNMAACLIEFMFIVNPSDAQILRTKQNEFAESTAKGILNYLGVKYIDDSNTNNGLPILSKTTATVTQMQEWAKSKGANQKFIDLAPIFYNTSIKVGVNPLVTYCQSAKETGYFKFGGVLDITYNNPCGMKNSTGGGDYDSNAHKRFKNWEEGIQAQIDHLALYAGATGYPKVGTPDPRHFAYLLGTAKTVEELGGKWAPSESYGKEIIAMIKEVEDTIVEKATGKQLNIIKMDLHGKELEVEGIYQNNTNYIPARFLEKIGYKIDWKDGKVIINYKED